MLLTGSSLLSCSIFLCSLYNTDAFIPDALFGVASPNSKFHTHMVKEALVQVAKQYFNDILEADGKKPLRTNNVQKMFTDMFGNFGDSEPFENVLGDISSATASIDKDKNTKKNPPWHFDSERIVEGHQKLQGHFKNIVRLIHNKDYDTARNIMGRALHPLQDFYSHTNWVEMGKKGPNYNLGVPGKGLGIKVANATTATCQDCKRDFSSRVKSGLLKVSLIGFAFGAAGGDGDNIFDCTSNVLVKDEMTSGYSVNQKDDNGNAVNKPKGIGKCSHGGTLDGSSGKHALGGINKDSESSLFSPHDYLHTDAQPFAINATIHWVNEIRKIVDDDQLFSEFFHLMKGTSIAFVVDASPAMKDLAAKVRSKVLALAKKQEDSHLIRYIVTLFGKDTAGPTHITQDIHDEGFIKEMEEAFDKEANRKYTSRRRKMYEAVIQAAERSLVGGFIYVIMNGDPTDEQKSPYLSEILINKRLKLNILYATDLKHRHRYKRRAHPLSFHPEARIVDATGGNIVTIDSATDEVISSVSSLHRRSQRRPNVIFERRVAGTNDFIVDVGSTATALQIDVTAYNTIEVVLRDPDGKNVTKNTANTTIEQHDRIYTIMVTSPQAGIWSLSTRDPLQLDDGYVVKASTTGSGSVKFQFMLMDEESAHPGIQALSDNVRAKTGKAVIVVATTPDAITPVYIEFRDMQGKAIQRAAAQKGLQSGTYYANMVMPGVPFKPSLFGFDADGRRSERVQHGQMVPGSLELNPYRLPESPREMMPGTRYGIGIEAENLGAYQVFQAQAWEKHGWPVRVTPRTQLIRTGKTAVYKVYVDIPATVAEGTVTVIGFDIKTVDQNEQVIASNHWHETFIVAEPDENKV